MARETGVGSKSIFCLTLSNHHESVSLNQSRSTGLCSLYRGTYASSSTMLTSSAESFSLLLSMAATPLSQADCSGSLAETRIFQRFRYVPSEESYEKGIAADRNFS